MDIEARARFINAIEQHDLWLKQLDQMLSMAALVELNKTDQPTKELALSTPVKQTIMPAIDLPSTPIVAKRGRTTPTRTPNQPNKRAKNSTPQRKRRSRSKGPVVVCVSKSLDPHDRSRLDTLASSEGWTVVEEYVPGMVTHLVYSHHQELIVERTMKYMMAVLEGVWILSFGWINSCIVSGTQVPEDGFEIEGDNAFPTSSAPFRAREYAKSKGPKLFSGHIIQFQCGKKPASWDDLLGTAGFTEAEHILIPRAGTSTEHHICVEEKCKKRSHVSIHWLYDSISQFQVLDPKSYHRKPAEI